LVCYPALSLYIVFPPLLLAPIHSRFLCSDKIALSPLNSVTLPCPSCNNPDDESRLLRPSITPFRTHGANWPPAWSIEKLPLIGSRIHCRFSCSRCVYAAGFLPHNYSSVYPAPSLWVAFSSLCLSRSDPSSPELRIVLGYPPCSSHPFKFVIEFPHSWHS